MSEARRYGQAAVAGVAVAFVMLVGSPGLPLTYVLAIALFVVAGVIHVG